MLGNVYRVPTVRTTVNPALLTELVRFLSHNRDLALSGPELATLTATRGVAPSPLGTVFARIMETGLATHFAFLRVPKNGPTAPEVITWRHVSFDVRQMGEIAPTLSGALVPTPAYADKIILNVTPMMTQAGALADQASFQAMVVRDALSRSFFNSRQDWLIPQLVQHICGVYSMTVSAALARSCNLSWLQQQSVATLFAYFFWQLCADPQEAAHALQAHSRELNLPEPAVVADLVAMADQHRHGERLTLDEICAACDGLQIGKLEVTRRVLNHLLRWIGPDTQSSLIALEYPPYFLSLILMAASGYHVGLANVIKQNRLHRHVDTVIQLLPRGTGFLDRISTEGLALEGIDPALAIGGLTEDRTDTDLAVDDEAQLLARLATHGLDDPKLVELAKQDGAAMALLLDRYDAIKAEPATEGIGAAIGKFLRKISKDPTPEGIAALTKARQEALVAQKTLAAELKSKLDAVAKTFGERAQSATVTECYTATGAQHELTELIALAKALVALVDHPPHDTGPLASKLDQLVRRYGAEWKMEVDEFKGLVYRTRDGKIPRSLHITYRETSVVALGYTNAGTLGTTIGAALSLGAEAQNAALLLAKRCSGLLASDNYGVRDAGKLLWKVGEKLLNDLIIATPGHILRDAVDILAAIGDKADKPAAEDLASLYVSQHYAEMMLPVMAAAEPSTEGLLATLRGLFAGKAKQVTQQELTKLTATTTAVAKRARERDLPELKQIYDGQHHSASFTTDERRAMVAQPTHSAQGAVAMLGVCRGLIGAVSGLEQVAAAGGPLAETVAGFQKVITAHGGPFTFKVSPRGMSHSFHRGQPGPFIADASETVGALGYTGCAQIVKIGETAVQMLEQLPPAVAGLGRAILSLNQKAAGGDSAAAQRAQLLWTVGRELLLNIALAGGEEILGDLRHLSEAMEDRDLY